MSNLPSIRPAPDTAEMIRVDQAGEYGATRIYAGQLAVMGDRSAAARLIAGRWTRDPEDLRGSPGGRVLRLRHPLQPESATDIRRRIAGGETWHHLVPPPVARYIVEHGLYGAVPVTVRPDARPWWRFRSRPNPRG